MPVQITINGENAAEAIREFAVLSAAFTPGREEAAPAEEEKAQKPVNKKPKEEKPAPRPEPGEETTTEEPTVTLVDIRAKAKEKGSTQEGKDAIKALLAKYGVRAVSNVPKKSWDDFFAGLDAI